MPVNSTQLILIDQLRPSGAALVDLMREKELRESELSRQMHDASATPVGSSMRSAFTRRLTYKECESLRELLDWVEREDAKDGEKVDSSPLNWLSVGPRTWILSVDKDRLLKVEPGRTESGVRTGAFRESGCSNRN